MSVTAAFYCAMIPRVSTIPQPITHCARAGRKILTPMRAVEGLSHPTVLGVQGFRTSAFSGWYTPGRNPLASCNLAAAGHAKPPLLSFPRAYRTLTRSNSFRQEIRGDHSLAEEPAAREGNWETTLAAVEGLITKRHREQIQSDSIEAVQEYLDRLSVDVKQLPVIHVAGTKGKGSTCTMVESILRQHGLKTGLYTSPHLIDVRERIRVNGDPLSRHDFSKHFWEVYRQLQDSAEGARFECLPGYFRYFTVMALTVFVKEQVDVAVVEVGLGGRLDATNVVHPTVCGVSSLGLDHTALLGNTIPEIAFEKAGIFKPGVLALTSPQQPEAMPVLRARAAAVNCQLLETAPLRDFASSFSPGAPRVGDDVEIGIPGSMQPCNAALAVALSQAFLQLRDTPSGGETGQRRTTSAARLFVLPSSFRAGLAQAQSLGRCQRVRLSPAEDEERGERGETGAERAEGGRESGGLSYYLDGAHTRESMDSCAQWFGEEAAREKGGGSMSAQACTGSNAPVAAGGESAVAEVEGKGLRVLVFYCSPDRDARALMAPLLELHAAVPFHEVIISSNDHPALPPGMDPAQWRAELAQYWKDASGMDATVIPTAEELISWVERAANKAAGKQSKRWVVEPRQRKSANELREDRVRVLMTGSLLLCGDVLQRVLHRSGGTAAVDAALKFSIGPE